MWKDIINEDMIIIDPKVNDKDDLFEKMVNHVYNHDLIKSKNNFLKALQKREQVSNTELMDGIAIPHARSETVSNLFLSIIIIKDGIDYENAEKGAAKIIFFFGCDEKHNKEYLQLLAKSNRLLKMSSFQEQLLKCNTSSDVMKLLEKYEAEHTAEDINEKYLMIVTIHKTDFTSDVLSTMVEMGITDASLVESTSMARKLAYEMPIFAGLSYLSQNKSKESNLILAVIKNPRLAKRLYDLLKDNGIDFGQKGNGFIQLIRIEAILGDYEEDIDI